jgi:predicted nucleic acid-binding protein
MSLYCDTNLLIRLYVDLPESATVLHRLGQYRRRGEAKIPVTWLHQLETFNAFEQLVFLTRQGGGMRMTPEKIAVAAAQFEDDIAAGYGLESTPLLAHELIKQTRALAQRHTAKHGFRAYDVAHVATALILDCDEFWSFDAKASQLAALEGLEVF